MPRGEERAIRRASELEQRFHFRDSCARRLLEQHVQTRDQGKTGGLVARLGRLAQSDGVESYPRVEKRLQISETGQVCCARHWINDGNQFESVVRFDLRAVFRLRYATESDQSDASWAPHGAARSTKLEEYVFNGARP